MTVFIKTDRHPELPSMRARRLGPHLRAVLARKWAERANRGEGPFVLAGKHKVSQGYSPADLPIHAKSGREWGPENAGLAYAFRDDDIIKVGKYQTDSLASEISFPSLPC